MNLGQRVGGKNYLQRLYFNSRERSQTAREATLLYSNDTSLKNYYNIKF
jgi:hypothetical protein